MMLEQYLSAVWVTITVILLYALYYGVAYTKIYRWIYRTFAVKVNESVFHAVFFRLAGFVIFGLLSALIFRIIFKMDFDFLSLKVLKYLNLRVVIPWFFALLSLAIIIPYINVKKSKQTQYPQFKIDNWTNSYKWLSYITWTLYLIGYEFMFRGILLFGTVTEFGCYFAVILNVILYAIAHIPKGKKEVLGCFILGPILCVAVLVTHNILIPIVLHVSVCLCNEYFSIRKEVVKK